MNQPRGFTIVELLIIISIISVLVLFGFSAFTKAQERQQVQQAKEQIYTILQGAQKAAYVGDKDCSGTLLGIDVTFSGSDIRTRALCSGGNGALVTSTVANVTFTNNPQIEFNPLSQGVNLGAAASRNLNYTLNGVNYRFTIYSTGTITYIGQV